MWHQLTEEIKSNETVLIGGDRRIGAQAWLKMETDRIARCGGEALIYENRIFVRIDCSPSKEREKLKLQNELEQAVQNMTVQNIEKLKAGSVAHDIAELIKGLSNPIDVLETTADIIREEAHG